MKNKYLFTLLSSFICFTLSSQIITFSTGETLFPHPNGTQNQFNNMFLPCDYNDDGYTDFVGKKGGNQLLLLKGNSSDTLEQINLLADVSSPPYEEKPFDILDIDQDGDQDIIAETYILFNEGNDEFSFLELDVEFREFVVAVGDFNNDNLLDILTLNDILFDPSEVFIHTNNGDNTFSKCMIHNGHERHGDTAIGDLDDDGDLDIVMTTSWGDHEVFVLKNNGNCQFSSSPINFDDSFGDLLKKCVEIKDMNNDNALDIILTTYSSIIIFENTDGFSTTTPDYHTIGSSSDSFFFKVGDLNNDQQLDIVTLNRNSSFNLEVKVLQSLGNFNYSTPQHALTFGYAGTINNYNENYLEKNVLLYDYNQDQKLDIIYTDGFSFFNERVGLLINETNVVSTQDITAIKELELFPNPSSNFLNIKLPEVLKEEQNLRFEIRNTLGQLVKSSFLTNKQINLNGLSKGKYYLLINSGTTLYRSSFIKN